MASLSVGNLSFILTDAELECWFESTGYPVEPDQVTTDREPTCNRTTGGKEVNRLPQSKATTDRNLAKAK